MLFDGEWTEYDQDLVSTDPLHFTDTKPYKARLKAGIESDRHEGRGHRRVRHASTASRPIVAAMEYGFIGGSMGVVVGEKITRAHRARDRRARCRWSSSAARAARA